MGSGAQKHYAVRVGRKPGIYRSWAECHAQTNGYSGAQFKAFSNQADAETYMKDDISPPATQGPRNPSDTFYAVVVRRVPGLYTSWDEVSAAIKDCIDQRYEKLYTRAQAEEYIRGNSDTMHRGSDERQGLRNSDNGPKTEYERRNTIDEKVDLFD